MKQIRPKFDAFDSPTDGSKADVSLDFLLNLWAIWMHTGTYGRGYPRKSPGMRTSRGQDLSEMLQAGNDRLIQAVDAAIDGLPLNERLAILRGYELTADVWRLREPWDVLEARARVMLRAALQERGVE